MTRQYFIFGKNIQISSSEDFISRILAEELSLYPSVENETPDLLIDYVQEVDLSGVVSANPSIHQMTEDGFVYYMGAVIARYYFKDGLVTRIEFGIKKSGALMRILRKLINIQFTSHKEAIGQWIHEHILVPYAFTDEKLALIHASAVQSKAGKTILFGGTGGVGKTSLEIALCQDHGASFISDDICIINEDGEVSPNLAYPKVYAYNIQGDPKTKKQIFQGRSLIDRLQFFLHSLRGKQFIRRRISPLLFYRKVVNQKTQIDAFLILFRCETEHIIFEKISVEKAAKLNNQVISREYNVFFDHLVWAKYNALAKDIKPPLDYDKLIIKNEKIFKKGLQLIETCWLVKIPMNIDHRVFQYEMIVDLKERRLI